MTKILRFPEIKKRTGLSSSTIKRLEAVGLFPKRIKISIRSIGWPQDQIESWMLQKAPKVVKKIEDSNE